MSGDDGASIGPAFNPGVCAARSVRLERVETDVREMKQELRETAAGLQALAVEMKADRRSREDAEKRSQAERDRLLGIAERQADALAGIRSNVGALESDVRHAVERQDAERKAAIEQIEVARESRSAAFTDIRTWVAFALLLAAFALNHLMGRWI